jgi:hypothetical protein
MGDEGYFRADDHGPKVGTAPYGAPSPDAAAQSEAAHRLFREKYGLSDPNATPFVPEHGLKPIKLPGYGATLGEPVVKVTTLGEAFRASGRVDAIGINKAEVDAALAKLKEHPADFDPHSVITGC